MDLREINSIGERTRERLIPARVCGELAAHGLFTVGLSRAEPGFRFVRQRPSMAQILACVAGAGRVLVDGAWRPLAPGEAYLTPGGAVRHAYEATGAWRVVWAHLDPERQRDYGIDPTGPSVSVGPAAEFERVLRGLDAECLGRDEPAARSAWVALAALQLRRFAGSGDADRLQALWQHACRDLAHPWTLRELATEAGVGPEQLRRLCQARHGTSPLRHLTTLRCEHAAAMLQATDLPIAAIAEAVGYTNAFAFSTAFRRWSGQSPSAFRAS